VPAKERGIVTSGTMSTRAGGTHRAGYELITTAPCPANGRLPRSGQPPGGTTDDGGSRRDPARLRTRRNRWRVRRRICLRTCLTGKDAELVHVPAVRFGLPARAGPRIELDQAQPSEETAIPSELRRVYDVAATWFRRPCRPNDPIAACRRRRGRLPRIPTQDTPASSASRSGCAGPAGTP
jgi:hypothetical protein